MSSSTSADDGLASDLPIPSPLIIMVDAHLATGRVYGGSASPASARRRLGAARLHHHR